jgi:hypothetical protein
MKTVSRIVFTCLIAFFVTGVQADPDNNSPPGLQGKGGAGFPKGLESHEKNPSGWSHGGKHGWDRDDWDHHGHHHHWHHHHHHHHHDND